MHVPLDPQKAAAHRADREVTGTPSRARSKSGGETYSSLSSAAAPSVRFTMLSASPTCLRSDTSRFFRRFLAAKRNGGGVSPRDGPPSSLVTAGCYCRGSDELESRLRCRYTSVP